jgi:hypothetical protein
MTVMDTTGIVFDGSRCLQYFTQYSWDVKATDGIDTVTSSTYVFRTPRSTGVNDIGTLPAKFSLEQNFPNPFNPATTIMVQTQISGWVILKVYDVLGREVATLMNEEKPPGIYSVDWNANSFDAGVYFYRLSVYPALLQGSNSPSGKGGQTNMFSETRKMLLIK